MVLELIKSVEIPSFPSYIPTVLKAVGRAVETRRLTGHYATKNNLRFSIYSDIFMNNLDMEGFDKQKLHENINTAFHFVTNVDEIIEQPFPEAEKLYKLDRTTNKFLKRIELSKQATTLFEEQKNILINSMDVEHIQSVNFKESRNQALKEIFYADFVEHSVITNGFQIGAIVVADFFGELNLLNFDSHSDLLIRAIDQVNRITRYVVDLNGINKKDLRNGDNIVIRYMEKCVRERPGYEAFIYGSSEYIQKAKELFRSEQLKGEIDAYLEVFNQEQDSQTFQFIKAAGHSLLKLANLLMHENFEVGPYPNRSE